ncbi:DUF3040 domain-containing protein [Streptacidiphilus sp. PB12-B1b]|uniref:DUF3040 domain-containing protein n=1 Tax=Streptacidiphilus sp. PB12-B1b TaxID=2705012 RepID=UPI0015FC15DE|nr:DUF3040 domain-containing protein [Streptacidiphilus sp. PB12-B1b]QMU79858.1 DUF3040 domain-containing protein [Streptacidiphilus sp. PB12-B1b]
MSLPMNEKRILADIERDLTALYPRLGRRMASFGGPAATVHRVRGVLRRRARLAVGAAVLAGGIIALGVLAIVLDSATFGAWSVTLAAAAAGVIAVCAVGRDTDSHGAGADSHGSDAHGTGSRGGGDPAAH